MIATPARFVPLVSACILISAFAASQASRPTLDPRPEVGSTLPVTAAGDTTWIADWSFDGGAGCDDSGWTRYDNRILNDGSNDWSVSADFAGNGGIAGRAAVLRRHDLTWPRDGYGNLWDYAVVLQYRGPAAQLSFAFVSDSEPEFDFVTVEADSLGLSEARVDYGIAPGDGPASYRRELLRVDGYNPNGTVTALALPDFGLPAAAHEVYIRFVSEHLNSDEDNGYPTAIQAGLVVDGIAVTGDLAYGEDFECGTIACLNPNVELRNTAPTTPFGEWARLHLHPHDTDACAEDRSCAWIFTDPQRPAYTAGMAFGPGGVVVRNWLDDIIVSPWVALEPGPGGITLLSFRFLGANNYTTGRIVMGWRVRSRVRIANTDTPAPGDSIDAIAPWKHAASFTNPSSFAWTTRVADLTSHIAAGTREVQVGFRVADFQYIAGAPPPQTLDTGPGPYLDRVRIGRRAAAGPLVQPWFGDEWLAQDAFPSLPSAACQGDPAWLPSTDRFGTCDFSAAPVKMGPACVGRYDSISVRVQDVRGAAIVGAHLYGVIVAGPHAGKAPPPWSVGGNGFFQVPAHPGTNPAEWKVDLDDDYFRGGDVLLYFFGASDALGGFASDPAGLAAEPTSLAQAEAATGGLYEVSFLPSIDWDPGYLARIAADAHGKLEPTPEEIAGSRQRACILYVDQANLAESRFPRSGDAHRSAFTYTLDQLGYRGRYDVYYQNYGGATTVNNQLAGRATVQQATGYALIVQDAGRIASHTTLPLGGSVEGYFPQTQWYVDWLAQAASSEAGSATLWLIGNDVLQESPGNPLLQGPFAVTLAAASQPGGGKPYVLGQAAFTWHDGGMTDFSGDAATLSGWSCPVRFDYDGLGATGGAVATHRYETAGVPGNGAVVMNRDPIAAWNTILMSYAWLDVRDDPGSAPGLDELDLAGSILAGVLPDSCQPQPDPTSVPEQLAALPQATRLHPNVPNPFNPITTIGFDLHRDQRVKLQVFDVAGRLLRTLVDARLPAGWKHRAVWDGRDEAGRRAASGLYFYRLLTEDEAMTRKMVLLQ